jgi:hypothetical protein
LEDGVKKTGFIMFFFAVTLGCLAAQGYEKARVYLVEKGPVPGTDPNFWEGMTGIPVDLRPWGGKPEDASGTFYLAADTVNLYVFAKITDAAPQENKNPAGMTWRGTSIEFFFGTNTRRHKTYDGNDVQIRLYGKDKSNPAAVGAVKNGQEINARQFKAYALWSDNSYTMEASFPLSLFGITKPLKNNQEVRCEFRINHAKMNSDRSVIVNWRTQTDFASSDPTVWSDGIVIQWNGSAR